MKHERQKGPPHSAALIFSGVVEKRHVACVLLGLPPYLLFARYMETLKSPQNMLVTAACGLATQKGFPHIMQPHSA